MITVTNDKLLEEILEELRNKYLSTTSRAAGIHMTQCIYCLTKSYWDIVEPLPPTKSELLLFSLGFGLEKMLLREESRHEAGCRDDIYYSPDFITTANNKAELKTTRAADGKQLPETWVEQIMGYCYAEEVEVYDLAVLHIVGGYQKNGFQPTIRTYTLSFEPEELVENWNVICSRRDVLVEGLLTANPPAIGSYCKGWECKNCRYKERCNV